MNEIIEKNKDKIIEICHEMKIKRFFVFGSVVTDKFNEKSDIDFLISFFDNISVEEYTDNFFALHYKLRNLFNRKIDIVTERTLSNPFFIESVNETKTLIYEA